MSWKLSQARRWKRAQSDYSVEGEVSIKNIYATQGKFVRFSVSFILRELSKKEFNFIRLSFCGNSVSFRKDAGCGLVSNQPLTVVSSDFNSTPSCNISKKLCI